MKKFQSLLALGLLCTILIALPADSYSANSTTVDVTSNSASGITNATLTATLADGTVLGFRRYSSTVYFCGAISQAGELSIPDSILDSSNTYAVKYAGYDSNCDFQNAQSVTSLTLPPTITTINALPTTVRQLHMNNYVSNMSSSSLSNLEKVLVPENHLTSYYDNTSWSNYVLINPEGTEPLRITINMTKPGEFAQLLLQQTDNWYKVNELTVVGELNTDDLNVFKRMKQLTRLDLSRAIITDIPNQFDGASGTGTSRNGFNLLEELILPEVNSIGEYAFAACFRLTSITMPKVNTIGYGAFSRLAASKITLPEGITSIANYAFYYSNLESITIPTTLTAISDYCFKGCSNMKSATIPSSVKTIGYESFRETGLTAISLPGVATIKQGAFYRCKELKEVTFAEGLKTFEYYPFYECTALTEIDLPSTLRSMESEAFYGCTNIKKVISRATTPPTHNNNNSILAGCDKTDVKLYVPAMSIDKYREESGWKTFYTILPLEEKTSNIHIYDYATINDASEFTSDCDLTLIWIQQNRNGSNLYYCGALDYNGSSTLSMSNFKQYQYLGRSSSSNPYSYDAHFTSLIANGTIRSDNVQTILRVYETSTWYFISLPYDVKVSDIVYTDGTQFAIRKYSGYNRAQLTGTTWVNLTADDVMNAYEGYILRCNTRNADFTFPAINNTNKNKVFEKESVVMPLSEYLSEFEHNRSWNLIGNPYPCYYDTRCMNFTAPITVWNRYNARYDAYSPVDDAYILHPAQSFFVQRPVDQESITFDKDGRQNNATAKTLQPQSSRRAAVSADRKLYNLTLSDGAVEDHTRFVINGDAKRTYELDKDASKFITADNKSLLIYSLEDGVKYAINERPMDDGIISMGFYAPADGEYTIAINTKEEGSITLIDHENNSKTELTGEYKFTTAAGYHNDRFSLVFGETTGINTINANHDARNADAPCAIYTLDGRWVGNYSVGSAATLPKGVYVINGKDVKRKIVVK